jgi:hypothetical protein
MDILEVALDDEDIPVVIFLLRADPALLRHELSDGTTCEQRLLELNELTYVKQQL